MMLSTATVFATPISQYPQQWDTLLFIPRQHTVIKRICCSDGVFIKQLQAEQARANEAAQKYQAEKNTREEAARKITREITHVIQKPVYQSCRMDADGLRLLESAIDQANRASQPHDNMPNSQQAK